MADESTRRHDEAPQASAFNISALAIHRPVTTIMLMLLLVVLGLMSYAQMETDLFPNVTFPFVVISTEYPGASPQEIETSLTKPMEEAISSVNYLKALHTTIISGLSIVVAEFEMGTDVQDVATQIREKLSVLRPQLPLEAHEPVIFRFDPASEAVISYAMSGPLPAVALTRLIKDKIQPALEQINGVGAVVVFGGTEREIRVQVLADRLKSFGLTMPQVADALRREGTDFPSGYVTEARQELNLRLLKSFQSVPAITSLPLATVHGQVVRLGDVARVIDGFKERRTDGRLNGKPAVLFAVQKRSGANTVAMVETIRARIAELQPLLPPGVTIRDGRDTSVFIRDSIRSTVEALLVGGVLAILVIFAFLRSWRATTIAALAIPVSVVATFGPMRLMGFSLNTMSLMALALVVGILVDDAVVDLENIYRHIQGGTPPYKAAIEATNEIWLAVVATTLTIVAVFLPVAFTRGMVGQFFKEFGLTVTCAVLFSLLVARTLTPTLAARFLEGPPVVAPPGEQPDRPLAVAGLRLHALPGLLGLSLVDLDAWARRWRDRYLRALNWALDHRWATVALAVMAFLVSAPLLSLLPKGFLTPADRGDMTVEIKLPAGSTLAETRRIVYAVEQRVLRHEEVTTTFATAGNNDGMTDTGSIAVRLKPRHDRKLSMDQVKTLIRADVKDLPGAQIGIIDIGMIGGNESDESRPVKLNLYGDNLEELSVYAGKIAARMKQVPRLLEIETSAGNARPELQIKVDRQRAGVLGIDSETVATTLRLATIGYVAGRYQDGDKDIDVRVLLNEADRRDLARIRRLPVISRSGRIVPLSAVASMTLAAGPTKMLRENRQRMVAIWANILPGTTLGQVMPLITKEIEALKLPPSLHYEFRGEAERMSDTFNNLSLALLLSFVFIYIVLASQFESFIHPLTIMVALPLSFVGAFLAMFISNEMFGLMGMIGIIMLMGLVTKNAILLVDYTLLMRKAGLARRDALLQAGMVRLRPILMTTCAMIMGMIPIAMRMGASSEFRVPMGVAVVGGLITSTLLTLVVVPVIYTIFDDLQVRLTHLLNLEGLPEA